MTGRRETTFSVPGMDCPTEEQLVRLALADLPDVTALRVDLAARTVTVTHVGAAGQVLGALEPLGFGARIERTTPVGAGEPPTPAPAQQRGVLIVVLLLNAAMFVVEIIAGVLAESTGLIADSLDMLADASVYGIALAAVGGSAIARRRAARTSGWLQMGLAGVVLLDVGRRLVQGSDPVSGAMIAVSALALTVNVVCLGLLAGHRGNGLHMRASWIFTTNDVLANAGVILAGILVAATGSAVPDLLIGAAVAVLVGNGARRILAMSR